MLERHKLAGQPSSCPTTITVFLAWMLVGCSDATPPGGGTIDLEIASGDQQTGEVAQPLPDPLVVRVRDQGGRPVAGLVVNFVVVKGGGSVFAGSASTTAEGLAQEHWTLGQFTRDSQQLEVRAVDGVTGEPHVYATFTATPRAGPPYNASIIVDTLWSAVGLPVHTPFVEISDFYGNQVPEVSVAFTVTAGGGSVAASPLITDANGSVRPNLTLGTTPGMEAQELTVSSDAQFYVGNVNVARVSAYPTTNRRLVIAAGDGQTGPAGNQLPERLVVKVVDDSGADVTDFLQYPMRIEFTSGGGSFGESGDNALPPRLCANGSTTTACYFLVKLGPSPGQNTFTVTLYGVGAVILTATGT
jgi:hypothetical protein